MKFRKLQVMSVFVVAMFFISMHAMGVQNSATAQTQITTNFSLTFETYSARSWESVGFYYQQALAPLGIDVEIVIKPWGQFVGDLLRISTGEGWDIATVWFTDGGVVPNYAGLYSTTFAGSFAFTWGHDDPAFQEQLLEESGLNQTEDVDALLNDMFFEMDTLKRWEMLQTFQDWYMNHLLYDYPNFARVDRDSMWRGYGGPNNELWDLDEGTIRSSRLGASWDTDVMSDQRQGNATTLRFANTGPQGVLYEPMQIRDVPSGTFATRTSDPIFAFDKGVAPHPNLALQWVYEDWDHDNDPSTPYITNGKHTFIFDTENWAFPATTDYQGNAIARETIDANDFAFTLGLYKLALDDPDLNMEVNGLSSFEGLDHWEVSTTVNTDDTLTLYLNKVTPEDFLNFGSIDLFPEHILGGMLHDEATGTAYSALDGSFNPQLSSEWDHWTTFEGTSLVGEYVTAEFEVDQGFYSFVARDDYPFINEWDTADFYAANTAAIDAVFDGMNQSKWATDDYGVWAPHLIDESPAYYWAYEGSETDHTKPTAMPIQHVEYDIIEDTNAIFIAFESGQIDTFLSSILGAEIAQKHDNSELYVTKDNVPATGPLLMYLNMKNEHLRQYDVRRAIAHAVDRQKIVDIHDGFGRPWGSPVGQYWEKIVPPEFKGAGPNGEDLSWVNLEHEIPYDYEAARDLMRGLGYQARDSAEPETQAPAAPVTRVVSTVAGLLNVGNEALIFFSAFSLIAVVSIRRFRKYE